MNLHIYIILLFFITTPKVGANRPEWVDQMIQRKFENRPELFGQWEDSQVILYLVARRPYAIPIAPVVLATGTCFGTLISDKHVLTKASCILEETRFGPFWSKKKWDVKSHTTKVLAAQVINFRDFSRDFQGESSKSFLSADSCKLRASCRE